MRKRTREEFIRLSNIKHHYKYNYDLVDYIRSDIKVNIRCPLHGIFEQRPSDHLSGNGCRRCANNNKSSNSDEFIEKAKKVHKNTYDYSKSMYLNNRTKLIITCKIHGDFEQIPKVHLNGYGCSQCSNKIPHTIESFIEKARTIHGDSFDYSLVNLNKHRQIILQDMGALNVQIIFLKKNQNG